MIRSSLNVRILISNHFNRSVEYNREHNCLKESSITSHIYFQRQYVLYAYLKDDSIMMHLYEMMR